VIPILMPLGLNPCLRIRSRSRASAPHATLSTDIDTHTSPLATHSITNIPDAQTLFALISLSSTYLVGALPLHLAGITEAGGGAAAPSAAGAGVGGGAAGAAGGAGAGGLGAPPAAAAPSVSPGSAARNTANTNGSGSGAGAGGGAAPGAASASTPTPAMPTTAELAAWTEARAQTMFARREAVRVASRAVGDVLKGVRQ
jgi:hypothetical protein